MILLLILLIPLFAWREVQILIDRGSWKAKDYEKLFWYIDWKSKWKNFDSFHVANGLITIVIIEMLIKDLPTYNFSTEHWLIYQAWVIIYWLVWMQVRDLFLHIVYKEG